MSKTLYANFYQAIIDTLCKKKKKKKKNTQLSNI